MQVNQANNVNVNVNVPANNNAGQGSGTTVVETNIVNINVNDIVEISGQQGQQAQQNRFTPDRSRMREIMDNHQRQVDRFRELVEGLLNQQAQRATTAGLQWNRLDPSAMVDIDEATRTAAQEAIGEGGHFSVDAVASRLLDFAVAISGGDPARIDVLQNAMERGFAQAERMFGGELPEISHQTLQAVMDGFDEWAANGNTSDISLLQR